MKKILLVEDDDILRKSLAFFLSSNDYSVNAFDNGADGIEAVAGETYDLVITDINLPFASGLELINAIRNEHGSEVPIIVLTSMGKESTELEVFEIGATEFIAKPFSPAVLKARIDKILIKKGKDKQSIS